MKEETFFTKITTGWRFIIYEPIRESLALEIGDRLRITIQQDPMITRVMVLCESGAHKPGLILHRKKIGKRGWATYRCTKCGKETPMLISKAEGEMR